VQRKNYGIFDSLDSKQVHLLYRLNTLPGSSGAPLFLRGALCGIHIGAPRWNKNAILILVVLNIMLLTGAKVLLLIPR
jgi:V8-like Glu-specific endopeptidase